MTGPIRPVAVLGAGVAAPAMRVAAADVAAAWGSAGGRGQVAVCDADEDSLTLAWQAAGVALAAAGVTAAQLAGLWWGVGRPPFAEGPSWAMLATAVGVPADAAGVLCSGSAHAGLEAVVAAWDALAAGHADLALVVVSDALVPGPGTAAELTAGAGAAAFVLGADAGGTNGAGPPARLLARSTGQRPVVDRYRGVGQPATADIYDGRLFRDQVYVPLLSEVGGRVAAADGVGGSGTVTTWSVADPDGKLAGAVARRIGGAATTAVVGELGDTGAAGGLIGLFAGALTDATPARVGVIGYGGGRATALHIEVLRPVPGAGGGVDALQTAAAGDGTRTAAGARRVGYPEVLRARGQLEPLSDPIPMGVPPASAAFVRGNVEMLELDGACCRRCGTISTPPSIHPACIRCGADDFDRVALARTGTVQTFVVNQTMPPPFQAPLPMVVVDLDDGARLLVQGVPADAGALAIGDRVALFLRRYAVERGIPVYGFKAMRVTAAPAAAGAGAAAKEGR